MAWRGLGRGGFGGQAELGARTEPEALASLPLLWDLVVPGDGQLCSGSVPSSDGGPIMKDHLDCDCGPHSHSREGRAGVLVPLQLETGVRALSDCLRPQSLSLLPTLLGLLCWLLSRTYYVDRAGYHPLGPTDVENLPLASGTWFSGKFLE